MHTILITGAGSGIGAATAQLLSANPQARLLLIGRRLQALESVREGLINPNNHICASLDISDAEELVTFLSGSQADLTNSPLKSVFANAGIGGPNTYGPDDKWDEIIRINLTGTYNTCMATLPWLDKATGYIKRDILITSSCLSRFGVPNQTAYVSSKTALLGLVRSLSTSHSKSGILINAINPGWVETDMAKYSIQNMANAEGVSYQEMHATQCSLLPTGRMSNPEEIASLVSFLFSDSQRSITGQALDINNGSWMG